MAEKRKYWAGTVFFLLVVAFVPNLLISLRKARDAQRKHDIGQIARAVDVFQDSVGRLPYSTEDGKLIACDGGKDSAGIQTFRACEWGEKSEFLPIQLVSDPYHDRGLRYKYISNGKYFQMFAHLEGKNEAEYNPKIEDRKLPCGNKVCNFGFGSTSIGLDKSLETIQNEE